jgi:hypothetical protein
MSFLLALLKPKGLAQLYTGYFHGTVLLEAVCDARRLILWPLVDWRRFIQRRRNMISLVSGVLMTDDTNPQRTPNIRQVQI